ncbi:hypothetical protein Tco_0859716 [Tanacetum coccineum]|uniref:Uncharacterized protein n=1 Tax=Tanacetum coccineum TaxID=301880 RepID=A0ABQ5BGS5_9ASTR
MMLKEIQEKIKGQDSKTWGALPIPLTKEAQGQDPRPLHSSINSALKAVACRQSSFEHVCPVLSKGFETPTQALQALCEKLNKNVQEKQEEKNVAEEQAAKVCSQYWKPPIFYDDDDDNDEESSIPLRYLIFELPLSVAITPDLPIMDSLLMEDEHLDTISKTEWDEDKDLVLVSAPIEDTLVMIELVRSLMGYLDAAAYDTNMQILKRADRLCHMIIDGRVGRLQGGALEYLRAHDTNLQAIPRGVRGSGRRLLISMSVVKDGRIGVQKSCPTTAWREESISEMSWGSEGGSEFEANLDLQDSKYKEQGVESYGQGPLRTLFGRGVRGASGEQWLWPSMTYGNITATYFAGDIRQAVVSSVIRAAGEHRRGAGDTDWREREPQGEVVIYRGGEGRCEEGGLSSMGLVLSLSDTRGYKEMPSLIHGLPDVVHDETEGGMGLVALNGVRGWDVADDMKKGDLIGGALARKLGWDIHVVRRPVGDYSKYWKGIGSVEGLGKALGFVSGRGGWVKDITKGPERVLSVCCDEWEERAVSTRRSKNDRLICEGSHRERRARDRDCGVYDARGIMYTGHMQEEPTSR